MSRRLWSASALLLVLAALALAIWAAIRHFPSGVTVSAVHRGVDQRRVGWCSRRGFARIAGFAVAGALAIAAVLLVIFERDVFLDVIVFVAMGAALVSARAAYRVHVALPRLAPPSRPVLFYNPKSGGGKATHFNLPDAARSRGIEPIELKPGDDLEQLVRDAVGRGANGLAMAGGDGIQAIVAGVAGA